MSKKLFVGSLAWATNDDALRAFFEQFGAVAKAEVVYERDNPGRSRGFGFVEFDDDDAADKAIKEADGKELDGRNITVNEAQSRNDNGGNRGGDRGSRGSYGGGRDNRGSNDRGGFRSRSW